MRNEVEQAYQAGGPIGGLEQVKRDMSRFLGIERPVATYHPADIEAGIPRSEARLTYMTPHRLPTGEVEMKLTEALDPAITAELSRMITGPGIDFEEAKRRAQSETQRQREKAALLSDSPRVRKFAMRNLLERGGPQLVEETMNVVAAEMGGEGGRVVEHVGGAMEWVPHGPGGIPQPPTGDAFYDPIAEEQHKIQAMQQLRAAGDYPKLARGGEVKKFQNGGLVSALVPEAEPPDPREELMRRVRMTKESALESLRAGRQELATRRAAEEEEDKRARWLALAQGMLAPTQTGGFGESLGMTAGLMRQEQELQRKRALQYAEEQRAFADEERNIEMDALRAEAGLLSPDAAARTMGTTVAYHPEDTAAFNNQEINPDTGAQWKAEDRRLVQLQQTQLPDGTVVNQYATDPETQEYIEVPSTLMPGLMGAIEASKTVGQFSVEDIRDDALGGLQAARQMPRLLDAQEVFNNLAAAGEITSGLRRDIMRVAEYFGFADKISPATALSEIQKLMGRTILDELQLLTGPKSDFEFQKVEEMMPNIGSDISVNRTILNKMIERYQVVIDEGEHSARRLADDFPDFAADYAARYERYRSREAERIAEKAAEAAAEPVYDEAAEARLIERIREMGPEATKEQHDAELDMFRRHFNVTDEGKITLREMNVQI